MATKFSIWVKNDAQGNPQLFLADPDAPAPVPVPAPTPVATGLSQHRGVNLTGGATAYSSWPQATGPVAGTNYMFMSMADVTKLMAEAPGINTVRVLFSWEALQPTEYATLATLSGNFKTYRDALYGLVDQLLARGLHVMLDVHPDIDADDAAYYGAKVGSTTLSGQKVEDLLANLWGQLAVHYGASSRIHYGLMNEPHDISAATWFACAQKCINAIRSHGGIGKIVVPGVDWTGASTWLQHNAAAWNLVDPINNLAVQVHLYFDTNAGGGTDEIASITIGPERLKDVVAWARSKKVEVWIAELGLHATNPMAAQTWSNFIQFYEQNRDVLGGFMWWAEGPPAWWGGYRFELLDANGPTANLKMIEAGFVPTP